MKCKVKRSGLRVMGFGSLPDVGSYIDVSDKLGEQLINQGIVDPVEVVPPPDSDDEMEAEE